jgi:hypothetical protein
MVAITAIQATSVPQDSLSVQIDKDLQDSLSSLAHKHVTISYALMSVILFLILAMGLGGWFSLKLYDREIQRAEAAEKISDAARVQYQQDKQISDTVIAQATAQLQQDAQQRQQMAAQIATLQQQIKDRDATSLTTISAILNAKTAQQAYADAAAHYKLVSPFIPGKDTIGNETLTFQVKDVIDFTATKVDDDTKTADLIDTQKQLVTSTLEVKSLNADLNTGTAAFAALKQTADQCAVTEKADQATINDYKKAAKRTKWQKFYQGAEKVAIFTAGAFLGHKL